MQTFFRTRGPSTNYTPSRTDYLVDRYARNSHVTHYNFGLDVELFNAAISYATKIANEAYNDPNKKLSGWDYQYLKRSFYQKTFCSDGAYYILDEESGEYRTRTFNDKNQPLSLVSMHTSHGLLEASGTFDVRFEQYRIFKVGEATGMNLAEFLEMPEYLINKIIETLRMENIEKEKIKNKMKETDDLEGSLENAFSHLADGSKY